MKCLTRSSGDAWVLVPHPRFQRRERCDDSSGIGVFHDACALLGEIAHAAGAPPESLAEALRDNGYGSA